MSDRLTVTTAASGDPREAHELATRFGLVRVERAGRPLHELTSVHDPLLVLAKTRADLHTKGRTFRASTGMAYLRVLRGRKGEEDPLVAAAHLKGGDRVLDCTLGVGGDALVAAAATHAPVVALEQSALLCAFTQAAYSRVGPHGAAAGRLVHIERADHREYLRAQEGGSFDVVLIDPMFRTPGDAGPLFELVRAHGAHAPLDAETLAQARRVARKGVLVKDASPGRELERLGLKPIFSRRLAAICFGWATP